MKNYLYKQFYRNRAHAMALTFLLLAGIMAIYTGKKFLDQNDGVIEKSGHFQKESIARNVKYHKDDLGLILYYVKFNLANRTPELAALSIGMRDVNPSVQGVTIRNLEEQRYNADFYNPANAAAGNFDFTFVLVFIFPLVIVAFCYNLISEEEESGRWKLLSVQSGHLGKFLDAKLLVRFFAVAAVYLLLILIATLWVGIPPDLPYLIFTLSGLLYIVFWFALCRWVVSFRKSSAHNALLLLVVWVAVNFIVPMSANMVIRKMYPVKESLKAVMEQREGYHNKWDEPKTPTMEKFYRAYPQFSLFKVEENDAFNWTWYYAMQHMGDVEAAGSSRQYIREMKLRNRAAEYFGFIFPNLHTQLTETRLAQTGMDNQLEYAGALKKFHERKRLFFYPLVFSGRTADAVDWSRQNVEYTVPENRLSPAAVFLPYLIIITLLIILSQKKYRNL